MCSSVYFNRIALSILATTFQTDVLFCTLLFLSNVLVCFLGLTSFGRLNVTVELAFDFLNPFSQLGHLCAFRVASSSMS